MAACLHPMRRSGGLQPTEGGKVCIAGRRAPGNPPRGRLELGSGSSSRGNLLGCRGGEGMRADSQPAYRLTRSQHLDPLAATDRAARGKVVRRHVATVGIQSGETVQVDYLIGRLEPRVGETLELGQPAVQRHLTALKRRRDVGPRLAALGAAPGGLALGGIAATDPRLRGVSAGRRAQVMNL